jgi:16S rRNA (adenine1518-N6/adenine1519-N6)-dimethyltransferase
MLTLKKSLGQHFLHDENICRKIVESLTVVDPSNVLEIGPGAGALTKYLLSDQRLNYKAIEVDDEKVVYLKKTYPSIIDRIIHIDFLKSEQPFDASFSIIGNFPYNISSQILFKILDWKEDVTEVIGMFQKEVALRVAASHGNKVYGILSVLIQAFYKVEYLFDVHENCFTPPPKVKSGVIRLTNTNNPYEIENPHQFAKMIKAAFGQRRKTLRNALKSFFPHPLPDDEVFAKRAEQLSVADFVALYKKYFSK